MRCDVVYNNVIKQCQQSTVPDSPFRFPALVFWWDFPVPGTRTLFYCCVEQALAVLPVLQTRAERGADTREVDLSPRLKAVSALKF